MDESLIPKRPVVKTQYMAEGVGVFFRLAFIFFITTALIFGGVFFYKNALSNGLINQQATLKKLEVEFESSLIAELDRVSTSITSARDLLKNHLHQSSVFTLLQENTLPTVTFTSFNYANDSKSLVLSGDAPSYADISMQSSVFESLSTIASAKFSNLTLRESGRVSFTLTIVFK